AGILRRERVQPVPVVLLGDAERRAGARHRPMTKRTKTIVLVLCAGVLLAGAVVLGMRDRLFTPRGDTLSPDLRRAVDEAIRDAPPAPAEAPKSNFSHGARPAGGK